MARIFTDGAEMQDTKFWDVISTCTVESANPFISPYYYETPDSVSKVFTAVSEAYFRIRIRFNQATALVTASRILRLNKSSTAVVWLALDGANRLICQATTIGVLETSAFVITHSQWYLIEFYFKEANAPNGRAVVKVDGNTVIDYTGDTEPASGATFDNFDITDVSNGRIQIDDIAMNDTTGGADNSYCGEGIVVAITPNSCGTHDDWHGSDGDSTDNYLMCDEFPSDGDSTYVYHAASASGCQEQLAMTSPALTGYNVNRIWAEVRARKTSADAAYLKLGQLASGGSDVLTGNLNPLTAYTRMVGTDSKVNPVDSGAWEQADLDAIELVMEIGAGGA